MLSLFKDTQKSLDLDGEIDLMTWHHIGRSRKMIHLKYFNQKKLRFSKFVNISTRKFETLLKTLTL